MENEMTTKIYADLRQEEDKEVKLSLCLIRHNSIKMHGGVEV
jgi:hypothetical protein